MKTMEYIHDTIHYDDEEKENDKKPYWLDLPVHPREELKYFKKTYDQVEFFNETINRINHKIKNYSEISPYNILDHLQSQGYTTYWGKEEHQKILNDMVAFSGNSETVTLYQLLGNLKYDPFDGYAGDVKYKSFQQIILDNQDVFIPWFKKWGVSYTSPLKDLAEFKTVFNELIYNLNFLMRDACECLHWEKNPLRPFAYYGIPYLTNAYDTPEHWLYDYLNFSTSPYDYVVYEFILLKNFHKLIKRFGH